MRHMDILHMKVLFEVFFFGGGGGGETLRIQRSKKGCDLILGLNLIKNNI